MSESGRTVVSSSRGDQNRSRTCAGFHYDEVTLVLLVLNNLSNYNPVIRSNLFLQIGSHGIMPIR